MPYVGVGLTIGKGFFGAAGLNPAVENFINAAGITDEVIINALNNYVNSLQQDGVWAKHKAIYPFVGGTSTSCSYNLIDPNDFQITWSGSPIFDSNGVRFEGTSYGDTNYNPRLISTLNDFSCSIYTNLTAQESTVDIGCIESSNRCALYLSFPNNILIADINNATDNSGRIFQGYSGALGFVTVSRNMINNMVAYKNGTSIASTSGANSGNYPNFNIYIGAANDNGAATLFSNKRYALAAIGIKLTDTDAANYYTATQAFQTALGRAI